MEFNDYSEAKEYPDNTKIQLVTCKRNIKMSNFMIFIASIL